MADPLARVLHDQAAYLRALDVAKQWHALARQTDSRHHHATAETCDLIARERFACLQRSLAAAREHAATERQCWSVERQQHYDNTLNLIEQSHAALQVPERAMAD
jgi:hypothetical protein